MPFYTYRSVHLNAIQRATNIQAKMSSWPPSSGLTTKLVPREEVILPIFASTKIAAPADVVWAVVLDTSRYSSWNQFCPQVTVHKQPNGISAEDVNLHTDTSFTFHVVMDASKPTKFTDTQLRVTDISTPAKPSAYIPDSVLQSDGTFASDLTKAYRISWTTEGGFVARGLRSERFHDIIPSADGQSCEVRTWECQGGTLARAVKWMYKDLLKTKFELWCADLKAESERRQQSR